MNNLKGQTQGTSCDDCTHYRWYYDYCDKWECEIDARAHNSCFKAREKNTKKQESEKEE